MFTENDNLVWDYTFICSLPIIIKKKQLVIERTDLGEKN